MPTPNQEYIQRLKSTVTNSPYPRHMAMTLEEIDFDSAVVTIQAAEFHLQPFGIVHGGVLATLIDTATFWAAFLRLPDGDGLVNIDLKLNYLKSIKDGLLRAEGKCLRHGRVISYAEARVMDADGALLAHGTSTLMALPDKGLRLGVDKFLNGQG